MFERQTNSDETLKKMATLKLNKADKKRLSEEKDMVVYSISKTKGKDFYTVVYATWLNEEKTAITTKSERSFNVITKEELIEELINL